MIDKLEDAIVCITVWVMLACLWLKAFSGSLKVIGLDTHTEKLNQLNQHSIPTTSTDTGGLLTKLAFTTQ